MNPQLIRRLRIAASVFFAVVCIAAIACWIRSYWRMEAIVVEAGADGIDIFDVYYFRGVVGFDRHETPPWVKLPIPLDQYQVSTASEDAATIPPMKLGVLGFYFRDGRGGRNSRVLLPFWFLVLVAGLLATLPNPRQFWTSIPFQFSLRTLLIATTLVAVVLGLGVWAAS